MNVDELKKNLRNVIERYRNKAEFTGEVCRDVMARDCLQVVEELEAQNKQLKQEVRCLNVKLSDESNNATILAEKLNEMNHAHKHLREENERLKTELKQTEAQDQVIIDVLRKENRKTLHALWMARAEWASARPMAYQIIIDQTEEHEWAYDKKRKWLWVERKCREKAKEFE